LDIPFPEPEDRSWRSAPDLAAATEGTTLSGRDQPGNGEREAPVASSLVGAKGEAHFADACELAGAPSSV
jgi:hypothetical protein